MKSLTQLLTLKEIQEEETPTNKSSNIQKAQQLREQYSPFLQQQKRKIKGGADINTIGDDTLRIVANIQRNPDMTDEEIVGSVDMNQIGGAISFLKFLEDIYGAATI
jgi:hypothetical protein